MGQWTCIGEAIFLPVILSTSIVSVRMLQRDPEVVPRFRSSSHPGCRLLLPVPVCKLSAVPGLSSVHEVHVWELVSGKIIATLHIKCQKDRGYQEVSMKIREIFHHAGIHNVTIQFENLDLQEPPEQDMLSLCGAPCISKGCAKHLCCPPPALPLVHVNGFAEHNGCPPLDVSRSEGLGRGEVTDTVIEVSLDGCVSDHGQQAFTKAQEDQCCVDSTHF